MHERHRPEYTAQPTGPGLWVEANGVAPQRSEPRGHLRNVPTELRTGDLWSTDAPHPPKQQRAEEQ